MVQNSIIDDAEKMADLFVAVLAKALANPVLDERFDGQVTMSQLQALRYLLRNEERLMSDLAEGLAISYPAATKTVERLVKKGLVVREGDPTDRRVVRVSLTDQGRNLVGEIDDQMHRRLAGILGKLAVEDRAALLCGMSAFVAAALDGLDRDTVSAICLHCGTEHQETCPVLEARLRVERELAAAV